MAVLGLVLAGGGGQRMGGRDKARLALAGEPLIAHVCRRLSPQVDRLAVSGREDYGSGLPVIADRADGVKGPLAGLAAAIVWLESQSDRPAFDAIATAPVDTPFLPRDLVRRLQEPGGAAIAETAGGLQPVFGYWPIADLMRHRRLLEGEGGVAMAAFADAAGAVRVRFEDERAFLNVNRPEDLATAETLLKARRFSD